MLPNNFLIASRQIPGLYLKSGRDKFLLRIYEFII